MVAITYPLSPAPNVPSPAQVRAGIDAGVLKATSQSGVHPTYVVNDGLTELFFKDYTVRGEPMTILAERMAFAGAHESAVLFYREPLSWMRIQPYERASREARTLRQWRSMGIDAPVVLGYDETGLVLESIQGGTLLEKVADATLEQAHIERLANALHTARESALYIKDPSYFHSDPKLTNAIVSEDDRVYLIDPGMITKDLPVEELDAAFSLSYLIGLEGILRDAPDHERARVAAVTQALADAYLEGIGSQTRERMLAYARPVSGRHISRMRRIPSAAFRRFARWLSYGDTEAIDHITFRIR